MTQPTVQEDPRTGDQPSPAGPHDWPNSPIPSRDPNPMPNGPRGPRYSPEDLMGETYFGLWRAGVIPPGPMRDPIAAKVACIELLRAFGVEVSE